jgi:hypothetical protein
MSSGSVASLNDVIRPEFNRRITQMFFRANWILPGLFAAAALSLVPSAHAKCTVTLKFTNNDTHDINILGNDSQARINGLTWSTMGFNDAGLKPGATGNASWTTNQSCGGHAKRDLRFKFQDTGDSNIYEKDVNNVDIDKGLTYSYTIKND